MTATLFSDLNEQGYKFPMITTWVLSHVIILLKEKGVRLFSLSRLSSEDLYKTLAMRWSVFFPTSVAKETEIITSGLN